MQLWKRKPDTSTRFNSLKALTFPDTFRQKILEVHPYADTADLLDWENGFRRYILLNLLKPKTMSMLAMPSEAVDSVWHAALLHTRWYANMCKDCLGWYMHHEPFSSAPKQASDKNAEMQAVANTYVLDCVIEGIPADGRNIPLLFRLDQEGRVANGYHYGTTEMVDAGEAEVDIARLGLHIDSAAQNITPKELLRLTPFMDQVLT